MFDPDSLNGQEHQIDQRPGISRYAAGFRFARHSALDWSGRGAHPTGIRLPGSGRFGKGSRNGLLWPKIESGDFSGDSVLAACAVVGIALIVFAFLGERPGPARRIVAIARDCLIGLEVVDRKRDAASTDDGFFSGLLRPRELRPGLSQDRNVWVGVFPKRKELLKGGSCLSHITR